jgi:hypothetical protein
MNKIRNKKNNFKIIPINRHFKFLDFLISIVHKQVAKKKK